MISRTTAPWHWSHLSLLTLLPIFCWTTQSWSAHSVLGLWLLFNLLLLALAERQRPFRAAWQASPADLKRDATVWSLNVLSDALIGAALTLLALPFSGNANSWPLLLQIVLGVWLAELGSYALHRLSHGRNWLWRVHLLHHLPDRLNLANSLTAHPLNAVYDKLVRLLPLLLLGMETQAILAIGLFQLTQSLVTHANIDGRIGWLNYLIGSAELHRLHHSDDPVDASNFGTAVPLWDQLFRSFRYAHAPRRVGVYTPMAYPGAHQLWALLGWPFRATRPTEPANDSSASDRSAPAPNQARKRSIIVSN